MSCDELKLLNWIEESDTRLVVYVEWAVPVKQCKRVGVVSINTDIFTLLLHYTPHFPALGLKRVVAAVFH